MIAHALRRVAVAVVVAGASCLALAACAQVTPVDQRGLVTLVAVDAAPGSGYTVSVEVLYPAGLPPPGPSGQGGGQSRAPVFIRTQTAANLASAISAISQSTYLRLDFTHLQGVVVSEPVARDGLGPIFNYLARSVQFSINGWVIVARGESAEDLLTQTEKDLPQPNEVLAQTVLWGRLTTPYYAARAFTLLKEMPMAGTDFATVGVATGSGGGSRSTTPLVIEGEALFRADRLVGWLDGAPAVGWAALLAHLQQQTLTVPGPSGSWQIQLVGSRRRVRITGPAAQPAVDISANIAAHLYG